MVFMKNEGAGMCLGGMLVSQSLQYGAKTLFRHSPERHNFCRLTILRHSNIKMVAYGSDSAGRGKCLFYVFFFLKSRASVRPDLTF